MMKKEDLLSNDDTATLLGILGSQEKNPTLNAYNYLLRLVGILRVKIYDSYNEDERKAYRETIEEIDMLILELKQEGDTR